MSREYKVGCVTVFCNEFERLAPFKRYLDICRREFFRHIIVDNNSSAEFRRELHSMFGNSSVILLLDKNLGVTGANNAGIEYLLEKTDADAVFVLVNDVELEAGAVTRMKEILKDHSDIGVVGPVLVADDRETIEEIGGKTDQKTFRVTKLFAGEKLSSELPDFTEVDFVCGGAYLVKRKAFIKAGLLDEKLFMYCDETEFNHRVQKVGMRLIISGRAIAYHFHPGSQSSDKPGPVFFNTRNQFYIVRKHRGFFQFFLFAMGKTAACPIQFLRYIKKGQFMVAFAFLRGTCAGMFLRMNPTSRKETGRK